MKKTIKLSMNNASKKKQPLKADMNIVLAYITIQRIVIMRENGVLIQMLM